MALNQVLLIVTSSLIVQLIVFLLLIVGYIYKRKQKYRLHGLVMTSAVVIHLVAIFAIMIRSFVQAIVPEFILVNPIELVSIVSLIHGVLGATAAILGTWRVVSWRFRKDLTGCINKKKYMLVTITVWSAALIFGIALYLIFLPSLLG
jgi:uncharacterized membrane protein YozB (DUF420 family)